MWQLEDSELWQLIVGLSNMIEDERGSLASGDESAATNIAQMEQLARKLARIHDAVQRERMVDVRIVKEAK